MPATPIAAAPSPSPSPATVPLPDGGAVDALVLEPAGAFAGFVLAHGAGAGMAHAFMEALAQGLAARRIATLRFQFPYMQRGSPRTDPPAVATAAVRAAVESAARRWPGLPLVAGGKSFGARMSSQAQAAQALPGVRGLVFVGFPLHPAGKPGVARAAHLDDVAVPMLFLQGTRDELADLALLRGVLARLQARPQPKPTLEVFDDADHAFHVRRASGRDDAQVMQLMLDATAAWIARVAGIVDPGPGSASASAQA